MAGHKGFGLGMLVEIMGGVLADSCYGSAENSASELAGRDRIAKGAAFVVLDVGRFLPRDEFERRIDGLIADVHASELAPGTERIYVPGELEAERREERRRLGIPLARGLVDELDRVAADLGCPPLLP
jgi:LDH2 family malate/lactate/ureidoglycolate dehydrogenase